MENKLVFDDIQHQYTYGGAPIPSVTQVLKGAGIIDFSMIPVARLEAACQFGTAAHRATALSDKKTLDEDALDDNLRPYLSGWRLFCQEYGFVAEFIEQPIYSKIYRVAGTPDRIGKWRIDDSIIIPDIKTGVDMPSTAIQLAGYELIFKEQLKRKHKIKRLSVLLNGEGTYKVKEFKDKNDGQVFIACLSIFNWKGKNGTRNNGT